jgi:hypothetical protein
MSVHSCPVLLYVLGFAFSIAANQLGVLFLTRKMRNYLEHHAKETGKPMPPHNPKGLTQLLGLTEAILYTAALLLGAKEFIAVWLALKAAVRWRATPSDKESGTGTDNLWLIGSGASVFVAYLGASIARWHLSLCK